MILRPYGVVVSGSLELGLELVVENGAIREIRPHTGVPDAHVISPAFVNAHSHLEYRGLQGVITEPEYWPWIRELTRLKTEQSSEQVRQDCLRAALENRATGVALIAEHSDRPFAGEALTKAQIGGVIFQEAITFFEREDREKKLKLVEQNAARNRQEFPGGDVWLSPHAYYTVDSQTLSEIGGGGDPFSIHAAETTLESALTTAGEGEIAGLFERFGFDLPITGKRLIPTLDELGLLRAGCQLVHCCDVTAAEVELIAARGVTVAHCPRSNERLRCPRAPIREMLDAKIKVGLGMDSPASSGPIDMFKEMRSALSVSHERGRPLSAEEVWRMATSSGAASFSWQSQAPWDIYVGSETPLIEIHLESAHSIERLIENGRPELCRFVPARTG